MNLLAAECEMASFGYVFPVKIFISLIQVLVLGIAVPVYVLGAKGLIGTGTVILCLLLLGVSSTGVEG